MSREAVEGNKQVPIVGKNRGGGWYLEMVARKMVRIENLKTREVLGL